MLSFRRHVPTFPRSILQMLQQRLLQPDSLEDLSTNCSNWLWLQIDTLAEVLPDSARKSPEYETLHTLPSLFSVQEESSEGKAVFPAGNSSNRRVLSIVFYQALRSQLGSCTNGPSTFEPVCSSGCPTTILRNLSNPSLLCSITSSLNLLVNTLPGSGGIVTLQSQSHS